jgi:hypothetical protein
MVDMSESIYITNMNTCEPASGISSQWERNSWRAVPYETVDGLNGTMLMATTDIDPPPVQLPLNLTGWFRIYLGLGCADGNNGSLPSVKVKLTDDPAYVTLSAPGRFWWMEFREIFWKETDVTGQSLVVAKPKGIHNGGPMPVQSYIAYVRLEPLAADEVEAIKRDRADVTTKRIIGTEDGWSAIALEYPTTAEELKERILPYQHSDVRTIFYNAAAGDAVNYPETKVGTAPRLSDGAIYPRWLDRTLHQSFEEFRKKRIDPVEVLCDFAHELGLEFHTTVRTGSFACEPPYDEVFTSDFYRDHPEFRCRTKDGREIARLSYAFPEVQQHMLELFCEITERNIDGFGLIFIRGLPVLLYEQPLIDGFKKHYGIDPRDLPDDDQRVGAYRGEVFTDFFRRVKTTLNALREKQGRPALKFSAIVPATQSLNDMLGLDVRTWAKEALLDILAPDFSLQDRSVPYGMNEAPENLELDFFIDAVKGTDCCLAPRLAYFHNEKGPQYLAALYDKGIDSGYIWDSAGCFQYTSQQWFLVRHYGHKDLVRQWAQKGIKPDETFIRLKTLGGFTMDQFPGNLAY